MEDLRRLSCIPAETEYHEKGQINDMQLNFEYEASKDKEYEVDDI